MVFLSACRGDVSGDALGKNALVDLAVVLRRVDEAPPDEADDLVPVEVEQPQYAAKVVAGVVAVDGDFSDRRRVARGIVEMRPGSGREISCRPRKVGRPPRGFRG